MAQKNPILGYPKDLTISRTITPIHVDGMLDEMEWQKLIKANHFAEHFPYHTSLARQQTEIRLCFDDNYLYIEATCFQPQRYTVQTLKRDLLDGMSDLFTVNLDPFGDHLNGLYFTVGPYGVLKDKSIMD